MPGVVSRGDVLSVCTRPDADIQREAAEEMIAESFVTDSRGLGLTVHRLVLHEAGAAEVRPVSSHGLGLDSAIGLARALDRMPGTLIVHAVEAADLGQGPGLTPAVAAVIGTLADAVLRDLDIQDSEPG